ncbi:MAG: polyprenyl synthetase family protein [Pirellulales bacterium]|nr:polyprenyl synthetase family protein [Pirellulales bacterium]
MTQRVEIRRYTPDDLQQSYALVRDELARTDQVILQELQSHYPFVDRLAKYGFRLGGKRLRPALVLLSGKACGNLTEEHFALAAAVEMIHTATLIHDDVLDEATMRRHLATVNAQWDNEASVLLGDYLFARAVCLAGSLETNFACCAIGEAARVMCEGELRQVDSRGNYDLTEEEYVEIIADKTAALCACCCRLGSHYAGASEDLRESMGRYGRHLGIAFQITDDILDVLGDERTTGKSLGTDLVKQKPTLPLIRLLNRAGGGRRREILSLLSRSENHRREALRPWFEQEDAIAYSHERAEWHIHEAKEELQSAADSPARKALAMLADFVVNRKL